MVQLAAQELVPERQVAGLEPVGEELPQPVVVELEAAFVVFSPFFQRYLSSDLAGKFPTSPRSEPRPW